MAPLDETQKANLRREHSDVIQRILAANADLSQRLQSSEISAIIDADDAILIIRIGDPCETVSDSINNSVFLNVDPETGKIMEIEISDLFGGLRDNERLRDVFLTVLRTLPPERLTFVSSQHGTVAQELPKLLASGL